MRHNNNHNNNNNNVNAFLKFLLRELILIIHGYDQHMSKVDLHSSGL